MDGPDSQIFAAMTGSMGTAQGLLTACGVLDSEVRDSLFPMWSSNVAQHEIEEALARGAGEAPSFGDYRLGPLVGIGGMGTVHLAWDAAGNAVALKRLLPRLAGKPAFVRMFRTEAHVCRLLDHPNIARFVESGEIEGEPFLVTEFVRGLSCRRLMRSLSSRGEKLPAAAVVEIAHHALSALAHAHEARDENGHHLGLVHRDVSPGNLLVTRDGAVKLIDFGIVQSTRSECETRPGELKGKPGYMSPEQVAGQPLDARSDLFSLGAVIAELFTLRPIFFGADEFQTLTRMYEADLGEFERRAGNIPEPLARVVRRALARDPADRYPTAREFQRELGRAAAACGLSPNENSLEALVSSLENAPPRSGVYRAPFAQAQSPVQYVDRISPSLLSALGPRSGAARAAQQETPSDRGLARSTRAERVLPILEGIAIGRVTANSPPDTGAAEPSVLDPAWAYLAERHPYRFDEAPGEPAFTSAASPRAFSRILEGLRARRATGLLVAREDGKQARIYFRAGEPVFASSTDPAQLLGRRLLDAGVLDRESLEGALLSAYRGRSRLGQALLQTGSLRAGPLLRALVAQLADRVRDVSTWNAGELSFHEGVSPGLSVPSVAMTSGLISAAGT